MEQQMIVMIVGFALAAYSVIGNDVIQTLGTFLSSNENRPWYVLFLFAGSILSAVLLYGWYTTGDVSYERLAKYPFPDNFGYIYLLPPIVLMLLTRSGIPVSTSFLILTFFNEKNLLSMTTKSMLGYLVAFGAALIIYRFVTAKTEKRFLNAPMTAESQQLWTVAQWCSTGFLWAMWLIQDFANIYVYLPRELSLTQLLLSLLMLLALLAFIFYSKGGAIQKIVKSKTNTMDVRSATFIDLIYGVVLFIFKEWSNIPMSTTWVFIGLLAGREIAFKYNLNGKMDKVTWKSLGMDLLKVFFGLLISILLVWMIKWANQIAA